MKKMFNDSSIPLITGCSINSKNINKGDVFFPLKGARFDGHDLIKEAIQNGASLIIGDKNINLGETYYHLENFLEAKIFINKAIEIMTWSNAVKDDLSVALYYILNEINLGNLKSASDMIPNPLKTVEIDEHWSSKNAVSINDWVSYYITEDNEDLLERTREVSGDLIFVNYNLYKIFDLLGDEEKAEKFINLSHDGIMGVASKLKRRDKQRFLNDNILIANIISDWNRLTH